MAVARGFGEGTFGEWFFGGGAATPVGGTSGSSWPSQWSELTTKPGEGRTFFPDPPALGDWPFAPMRRSGGEVLWQVPDGFIG